MQWPLVKKEKYNRLKIDYDKLGIQNHENIALRVEAQNQLSAAQEKISELETKMQNDTTTLDSTSKLNLQLDDKLTKAQKKITTLQNKLKPYEEAIKAGAILVEDPEVVDYVKKFMELKAQAGEKYDWFKAASGEFFGKNAPRGKTKSYVSDTIIPQAKKLGKGITKKTSDLYGKIKDKIKK